MLPAISKQWEIHASWFSIFSLESNMSNRGKQPQHTTVPLQSWTITKTGNALGNVCMNLTLCSTLHVSWHASWVSHSRSRRKCFRKCVNALARTVVKECNKPYYHGNKAKGFQERKQNTKGLLPDRVGSWWGSWGGAFTRGAHPIVWLSVVLFPLGGSFLALRVHGV